MDWLLKIVVLWLSIDLVIFATTWYAVRVIKLYWPEWWRRVIDEEITGNDEMMFRLE